MTARTAPRSTRSAACSTSSPGWSATASRRRLVAAMDADWRPAFRVDAIPSYKAHRVATGRRGGGARRAVPAGRRSSRTCSTRSASPASGSPGYEADDVIGTLATRDPGPVDVVTGDRDLFQLVDDARGVRVLYTARGVGRADVVDEAWVAAKYGIPGRAYADFATLRGDPSDGLPGVAGRRRQDRGRADHEVRLARRRCSRRWTPVTPRCRPARAASWPRRATTWRWPRRSSRWPPTCRCRRTTTRSRATPRDPDRLVELSQRWGLDSPLNRVLSAFTDVQPRTERLSQVLMPRAASSSDRLAA